VVSHTVLLYCGLGQIRGNYFFFFANGSLKDIQENTIKQVKEINKTVQNLKMEIEAIKKT